MQKIRSPQNGNAENPWRCFAPIGCAFIIPEKSLGDLAGKRLFGLPSCSFFVVLAICGAAFCFAPTSILLAHQRPGSDDVVEKLVALLTQYQGMEFQVEQDAVGPNGRPIKTRGLVSLDGTEVLVEKSFDSSDGVQKSAYYGNNDYAYSVSCTATNVFYAYASTKPEFARSPFVEIGPPLIFFFGRTCSGKRLTDFFAESKPKVSELSSSGESGHYAVTVASKTEGLYRFEVSDSGKSLKLTSVLVEETPESVSAKNGQSVELIRSVFRKQRFSFKDIDMLNGKIDGFFYEVENELPNGATQAHGDKRKVTVISRQPLPKEIVRSTKMFSVFEIPGRVSATIRGNSLAPHAIVDGSLVRLDVHYDSKLSESPTPLRKTWFQKYWIVVSCVVLIGATVFAMMGIRWMKRVR